MGARPRGARASCGAEALARLVVTTDVDAALDACAAPVPGPDVDSVIRFGQPVPAQDRALVMAIVNRTPDSFYDRGATFADDAALDRVDAAVAEGADIIDIGGVKAGPGDEVDLAEEIRRVVPFVAAVRAPPPRRRDQRRHLARPRSAAPPSPRGPTCSTTPGRAPTRRWARWPRSSASASSARTPVARCPGSARTGSATPTWSPM